MGSRLWPANDSNPTGFFEDEEVNGINEDILSQVVSARRRGLLGWMTRHRPGYLQRWLSEVEVGSAIPADGAIGRRIGAVVSHEPYCLKDPRFCYTLPAWRPWLRDAKFLVVFRHPATTVNSVLLECRTARYLRNLRMRRGRAFRIWTLMYRHILETHRRSGEWAWFHYDQLRTPEGADRLERFCGFPVDRGFARAELRRSLPSGAVPADALAVYDQLRELALFREG